MSDFNHEIIIDRIACPLHVLQIKQGMSEIKTGEILKIIANDYVMPELLATARQIGTSFSVSKDNHYLFVTK